jgi:NADPH-dependent glutamate synthase beta subunit-like oxidoreductase
MAIVAKKRKKKRGLKTLRSGSASPTSSMLRPMFAEARPPCVDTCPNHNAIREMLTKILLAKDHEQTYEQAFTEGFQAFMETTPFPAVCGRVCPHPCETGCNRNAKDSAVGINKVERFIGDFGLDKGLKPRMLSDEPRSEKIAVVGSGPGGLSAAYQLARRGYPVTVFEAFPKSGGMLRYGIPDYRLPQSVLDAEIDRILEMGVDLRLNTNFARSTRRYSSPSVRTRESSSRSRARTRPTCSREPTSCTGPTSVRRSRSGARWS